jgi:hypothetical protein
VTVARALQTFGRFWWDFLVGDTPELAVGALAVIGLAAALAGLGVAAAVLLPLAVVALLAVSVRRGARHDPVGGDPP